jgi:Epoxide hydrolase N terminus
MRTEELDDIGIHFIRERGKGPNLFPIRLTHGYPDSFYRFAKIIPTLTNPESFGGRAEDAFDVVVPDLPGYGFSDRPRKMGMVFWIHDLWARLMTDKLGLTSNLGRMAEIGAAPSRNNSRAVIPIPSWPFISPTFRSAMFFKGPTIPLRMKRTFFKNNEQWTQKEGAYALIQSTKPQSLAHGLNDSPAGLAAWIVEQFRSWSDCVGKIKSRFTKDELLTHIMIRLAPRPCQRSA